MNFSPGSNSACFVLLALLACLSGPAGATEAEDAGQDIAAVNCAPFHAITSQDASPMAEAAPFRTFKTKWPLENLEEALAEGIVTGHIMPMFEFDPDKIADLLAFIDTLPPSLE